MSRAIAIESRSKFKESVLEKKRAIANYNKSVVFVAHPRRRIIIQRYGTMKNGDD